MTAIEARKIIMVEYWPNTNQWRIVVAGIAVGYWSTKETAMERARDARAALRNKLVEKV